MSARAIYGLEFDRLTATTDEVRARRAQRSAEVHAFCAKQIAAAPAAFPYRNAMQEYLLTLLSISLTRPLRAEDKGHVVCATIALWGEHARQHGTDVRRIAAPIAGTAS